jgi:hypothetical protein
MAQQFAALTAPVIFQQRWNPEDDDIQEATDDGSKNEHPGIEQGCRFNKSFQHEAEQALLFK